MMNAAESPRVLGTLAAFAAVLIGLGLYLSVTAPPEETQGEAAKLLFVHVPSAVTGYVALGVGLLGAVWYLIRRSPSADLISAASIEIGVLFTALTLLTGMIWGRPVWGLWWDWSDARMMSTAVLFFFYVGYLALRRSIADPRVRAGRCAVLGVVAFVQVPIVHYSVLWFRTLHQGPTILRPDPANATMDAVFARALGVSILAFVILFLFLLVARVNLARAQEAVTEIALQAAPISARWHHPDSGNRMDSGWVVFGYIVAYGSILAYIGWIGLRIRSLRRSLPPPR